MIIDWCLLERITYKDNIFWLKERNYNKRSKVFLLICEICGDEFISKRLNTITCSPICRGKRNTGQNNSNYGKKLTDEQKKAVSEGGKKSSNYKNNKILSNNSNAYFIISIGHSYKTFDSFDEFNNFIVNTNKLSQLKHLYNVKSEIEDKLIPKRKLSLTKTVAELRGILRGKKKNATMWSDYILIRRGWDKEESIEYIKNEQSKNSLKRIDNLRNEGMTDKEIKEHFSELGKRASLRRTKEEHRKSSVRCVEYWMERGYTKKEAKEIIRQSCDCSLEGMIKRYGEKEGTIRYNRKVEKTKKSSKKCVEYWMEQGYNFYEAKEKVSEHQTTFSLEICIKKHGKEKGYEIWKDRQERWMATMNSKSDEEKEEIRIKRYPGNVSKAELELCESLECGSQKYINGYWFDIYKGNKIIEYNGDYFHCNPNKYSPTFFNKSTGMYAAEKWEFDREKIETAKRSGYDVLVVWEEDYKRSPEKVIEKCKDFLEGK